METIVMSEGEEAWQYVNYELSASTAASSAEEFAPSTRLDDPGEMTVLATEGDDANTRTTVLRDELRVNILQRRFQKGLGAVQLDWRFANNEKLTPEEEEKRRMRRERNRVAASRCRDRRRERTYILVTETDQLEASNKELMTEIQELETERQELLSILATHQQACGCSPPVMMGAPVMEELHIDP